jgi:O-antigen ligase
MVGHLIADRERCGRYSVSRMNRERVERWCERGILGLVLAILVFGPLALGGVRGFEFGIIEGLTAAVMLLWAVRLAVSPRSKLLWPPLCWAVLAFALYALGRYFTADIEYVARQELLRVLVYTFLFFAVLNNLHGQESVRLISLTLIFLAMLISFYAVFQFLTGSTHVWWFPAQYPHRASGTYICPNHLGGFLEVLLPLALAYAVTSRLGAVAKIFVGYAALVVLAGLAVTVSRGAWAATALAFLLLIGVLLFQRRYRLPALIVLVLIGGGIAYYAPRSSTLVLRLNQVWTQQGTLNDDLRFSLWRPAWRMWQDHPWWGVGPGLFDARFRAYRPERVQADPDRVHNDYLNTLADWGMVGTALVASAWVLLGWGIWKTAPSVRLSNGMLGGKSGSNKFAFVLGASLGLIALLAHSVVDFNFHIPANAILAITLMALLSSFLRFATEAFWFRTRLWTRVLAGLVLVCGAGYLLEQGWRGASEFTWLQRAGQAPASSPQQIALLKRAEAIEPANPETARALGEAYRRQSQAGADFYEGTALMDYRQLATNALQWFARGIKLNPWDCRNFTGYGWCLDWLDRTSQSGPYFARAEELDPNNYFNLDQVGLHYVQTGDFAAARSWFDRSLRLEPRSNTIARSYLLIVQNTLLQAATNAIRARLDFPTP